MSEHERWGDAAGAYVLGALPEDERGAYEAHLAQCPTCRAEIAELRVAAHALPLSAPALNAPPALKARIMAEVNREAALLASAGAAPRPQRRRWQWRVPAPAFAFACAALIAGLVLGGLLFDRNGGRSIDFQSALPQASAELELTDSGAIIVADNLPRPQDGKVYMVWLQRPGRAPEPTSALFTPRSDGSATASVTGDLEGVETVLINTEPVGGSAAPTSTPVLTAGLS